MDNLTTYKFITRKGIDDLKSLYAFHGSSQGDHTRTNSIQEFKDAQGWLHFTFDCEMTEEAIKAEIKRRDLWNNDYLKRLRDSGEYGKEQEQTISFQHNPAFDLPLKPLDDPQPLSSYSLILL